MIRVNAGGECTALFESYHPLKARAVLEKFYIGDVVEEEEEKEEEEEEERQQQQQRDDNKVGKNESAEIQRDWRGGRVSLRVQTSRGKIFQREQVRSERTSGNVGEVVCDFIRNRFVSLFIVF